MWKRKSLVPFNHYDRDQISAISLYKYTFFSTVMFPAFAEWGSERVEEHTPPVDGDEARELYQGWKRGIQGHLNSCYLDASLFRWDLGQCMTSVLQTWDLLIYSLSKALKTTVDWHQMCYPLIFNKCGWLLYVFCVSLSLSLQSVLLLQFSRLGYVLALRP